MDRACVLGSDGIQTPSIAVQRRIRKHGSPKECRHVHFTSRFLNAAPITAARRLAIDSGAAGSRGASKLPHPPDLVRDMVGASHRNIARVKSAGAIDAGARELGLGVRDWEDAISTDLARQQSRDRGPAPSMAHGAIFSAAMLGRLMVRAFMAASPGIEATRPHGITLLRHAMAGGPGSQAVVEYLKTLPGADKRAAAQPISQEELAGDRRHGVFGAAADQRIVIALATSNASNTNTLTFTRPGASARGLTHVGDRASFRSGAEVRIRFTVAPVARRSPCRTALTVEATRR
jgi:hypothetical protein